MFSLIVKMAVLSTPLFIRVSVSSIIDILRVVLSPSSTYIGFWFRQKSDLEKVETKPAENKERRQMKIREKIRSRKNKDPGKTMMEKQRSRKSKY